MPSLLEHPGRIFHETGAGFNESFLYTVCMEAPRGKRGAAGQEAIAVVRDFWERNPNQLAFLEESVGTRAFYEESDALRYRYHHYLPGWFDRMASRTGGGELLEIGCGNGGDLAQLARRGMRVTGIDLTERAASLARVRLELLGIPGEVRVADAEDLPFPDGRFDVVYSFGVLHHTPDIERALSEVRRVLRPGGWFFGMLYHRCSLNYWVHRVVHRPFDGSRKDPCPVERACSRRECLYLFRHFGCVHVRVDYLFGTGWAWVNRCVPRWLHRGLGRVWGWHCLVEARKMDR
jgi:SAM-dependent methyltransferase